MLAGKARRKKLLSPKGKDVRPMMEVVKGAAFGILQVNLHFLIYSPSMLENIMDFSVFGYYLWS